MSGAEKLLAPGDLIAGKYRIQHLLAEGGCGAVFVAEHTSTESQVALKVLWPYLQTPDVSARFELEARVAARLRSDFVVRTLDAGKDPGTGLLYLVMELLEGESLADRVKARGALPPVEVVRFLVQTALALDKAHAHVGQSGNPEPIVHRDLKPDNLFLCRREDAPPIIKVLDFGIAKVVTGDNSVSQDIKATPLFMAFEQASGDLVGPWTDIWALGLNAFYLLTGEHYWLAGKEGIGSLFYEVLGHEIVPPSARARELGIEPTWPEAFDEWFLRCVNRDVTARFQKAGQAAAALGEALLGSAWAETMPIGIRFDSIAPSPSLPGEKTLPPVSSNVRSRRRSSAPVLQTSTLVSAGRRGRWWAAAAVALVASAAAAYWSLSRGPSDGLASRNPVGTIDAKVAAPAAATSPAAPSKIEPEPALAEPERATNAPNALAKEQQGAPPAEGAAQRAPAKTRASSSKVRPSEPRTQAAPAPAAGVYSER